jgi:curved DNA-binding protein
MPDSAAESCQEQSLYDVLQVNPHAELRVIRAAYRALSRLHHPDANHDPEAPALMRRLNAAYAVLADPERRAQYDAQQARYARTIRRGLNATRPRLQSSTAKSVAFAGGARLSALTRLTIGLLVIALLAMLVMGFWYVIDG